MQARVPSPVTAECDVIIHVHGFGQHADQQYHHQGHNRAEGTTQDERSAKHGDQPGIDMQGIPRQPCHRKYDEFYGLKRCDFHTLCAVLFNVLFLDGIGGQMDLSQEAQQPCNQCQHGHDEQDGDEARGIDLQLGAGEQSGEGSKRLLSR